MLTMFLTVEKTTLKIKGAIIYFHVLTMVPLSSTEHFRVSLLIVLVLWSATLWFGSLF